MRGERLISAGDSISREQVTEILDAVRSVCGREIITDIHVHATEVLKGDARYKFYERGIFGVVDPVSYHCPKVVGLRMAAGAAVPDADRQNKMSELAFSRAYRFTGPTVLGDQMELANVDRAVLLPVVREGNPPAEQMKVIDACCAEDDRFVAGFCISAEIQKSEIGITLDRARDAHAIRIVKVHPNITGIDLAEESGKERLSDILSACGVAGLPVLLHGGCSPILGSHPASKFGVLEKLAHVDWSLTDSPVVIAHFGVYGCAGSPEPASKESLDLLDGLLSRHSHIYVDTSGVPYDVMRQMIGRLDSSRIVFGSDSMYVPMYRQVVALAHALLENGKELAEFRMIACDNPLKILGF